MRITRFELFHRRLPVPRARISLTESERSPEAVDLIAIYLHTDGEGIGLGFTVIQGSGAGVVSRLLEEEILPHVVGEDPLQHERVAWKVQARLRHLGWGGPVTIAYAAVDIALWDLKGKAARMSLAQLLGGARATSPIYVSDLALRGVEVNDVVRAARPLIEQGILGVLVTVGGADIQQDADRVQQIRDGLGEGAWLGVTAEGRYDLGTALALGEFLQEEIGADWYEHPIPVEDRRGYVRLAERLSLPLALGTGADSLDAFRRMLEEGHIRVLRPDILRLGGITPFLKVAALAEAFGAVVAPYRLPEVNVHMACGLPNVRAVESVGYLSTAFREGVSIVDGVVRPTARPGLGLELA